MEAGWTAEPDSARSGPGSSAGVLILQSSGPERHHLHREKQPSFSNDFRENGKRKKEEEDGGGLDL